MTTVFTLIASNEQGSTVEKQVTVTPPAPPIPKVETGAGTTLPPPDSNRSKPKDPDPSSSPTEPEVSVETPKPRILYFRAKPSIVTEPSKVELCYSLKDATRLRLDSSDKEFKSIDLKPVDDCIRVDADKTTQYTLTASNEHDSVARKATVRVIPPKDEGRAPPPATKNETGWCCLSSKRSIVQRPLGGFPIAPQVLQQKCLAVELTEDACIARKGKFFKTKAEACKNCLR